MIPKLFPVACHTDNIGVGSTFVVIQGMAQDGARYIPEALKRGASTLVLENNTVLSPETTEAITQHNAHVIRVKNTRLALAELSAQAYDYPARKLNIIAITGTKGKTTTSFLLEHILKTAGHKTALLSTVYNRIGDTKLPTQLTTQQPDYLHAFFDACVKQNVKWVVMEVAAQATSLHRVHDIFFDALVFTNFSNEHGEFYNTQDEYFAAKAALLAHMKPHAPIFLNAHDTRVSALAQQNTQAILFSPTEKPTPCPALIGDFNQENIAACTALAESIGIHTSAINNALASFQGVPGRLERYVLPNGATAFIDYAHNPSSFEAVLATLKKLTNNLIVVFGCGGQRAHDKRPHMGAIATNLAHIVILTSDNPRTEDPQTIIHHIQAGIPATTPCSVYVEIDREKAIKKAYTLSTSGSIIALLGKGPDEYQIIGNTKIPFSERTILQSLV